MKSEGVGIGKYSCIDCTSSDGLEIYKKDDGTFDGWCWAKCEDGERFKSNNRLAESEHGPELGIEKISRGRTRKYKGDNTEKAKSTPAKKKKGAVITEEQKDRIKENSSAKGKGYRGIRDETLKYFGVRTSFDGELNVTDRWYPVTESSVDGKDVKLTGYKQRVCETKDFYGVGCNSKESDMFGLWRCKGGKYLLITAGEEDSMAASQMLYDDQKKRGKTDYGRIDVISSSIGEGAIHDQARIHYDRIDLYDIIIVDMDEDEAGKKAEAALIDVLPAGKVRVMSKELKDANDYLLEGREKEYVRLFYDAKRPTLAGIVTGASMWESMVEAASKPLIPLPPVLKPLEDMLSGGLPTGEIINILAASGVGKTTITNLFLLYWVFNAPYKVGILSLEAGAGKFLLRLTSAYMGKSIAKLRTPEDKLKFLEDNKGKCFNLFLDENEEERFCLVDDRGDIDSLAAVKKVTERMIKHGGCNIIVIDPLQDLLDTLTIEEQAAFIGWQKKIKARDGVTFVNVNHTRKSGGGSKAGSQGGELTEEDMQGTSSIYKSGAVNIIMTRNKTAEDVMTRNTTRITVSKSRDAGDTGPAGELYYDIDTATLHNKREWLEKYTPEESF